LVHDIDRGRPVTSTGPRVVAVSTIGHWSSHGIT
jgi:hypothetical protein